MSHIAIQHVECVLITFHISISHSPPTTNEIPSPWCIAYDKKSTAMFDNVHNKKNELEL